MIIDVLALGESKKEFNPSGNITVGVNDIYSFYPVDYLVLVDPPQRFEEPDRYKTIIESTPKEFLCNSVWPVNNFKLIKLAKIRGDVSQLDGIEYPYSNNSAFVACVHAYKLGAKMIRIYGADFNSHQTLSNDNSKKRILKDFKNLNDEMLKKGVTMFTTSTSLLAGVLPVHS